MLIKYAICYRPHGRVDNTKSLYLDADTPGGEYLSNAEKATIFPRLVVAEHWANLFRSLPDARHADAIVIKVATHITVEEAEGDSELA